MAKRAPKSSPPAPELGPDVRILVLRGKERFLRSAYTDRLIEAIRKAGETVDIHRFDGTQDEPGEVLDECRSFGLMGGHKVVILDEADAMISKENRPAFERYAASPTQGCTLVLRCDSWRRGNLDERIGEVGGFIDCETPDPPRAAGWVRTRVTRLLAGEIDDDAAAALVERVGCELDRLAAEADKLASAAGKGGRITVETVSAVVGKTREEEVWDIQRRLLMCDTEGSIAYVRELVTTSRQPAILVRWAIVDLVRKLHALALANAAGPGAMSGATKAVKLWGPSVEPTKRAAERLSREQANALMRAAMDADIGAKSGLGDELIGLETLSLRVIDAVRPPAAAR